jgi:mercuric ion transport protein
MKNSSFIFTAVITAVLSSICCLPALLFLFFGVSMGSLSFLTQVDFLRIPFGVLSIVFFIIYFIVKNKKVSCECNSKKIKTYSGIVLFGLGLTLLLFYPEFAVYFVE